LALNTAAYRQAGRGNSFEEQLTSITYVYNNAISGRRTIGNLTFQCIKIADQRLGGHPELHYQGGRQNYLFIQNKNPDGFRLRLVPFQQLAQRV